MKKKSVLAVLIAMLLMSISACSGDKPLRFGTGNSTGNYYAYGNLLKSLWEKDKKDLALEVKETAGSAANLRLMRDGFLDLAIVQSDVLSDAMNGTGAFREQAYTNVSIVSGLYIEQLQIVVAKDSDIREVADLKGKRVSIGEAESGVCVVAEGLIQAIGLRKDQMTISNLSFSASAQSLEKGEIDAFFIMAGAPTKAVTDLAAKKEIRLLPLDERTIDYMVNLYDGYSKATVPAGTYKGQDNEVTTIGVKAFLVADKKVKKDVIDTLTELLFKNDAEFQKLFAGSEQ